MRSFPLQLTLLTFWGEVGGRSAGLVGGGGRGGSECREKVADQDVSCKRIFRRPLKLVCNWKQVYSHVYNLTMESSGP